MERAGHGAKAFLYALRPFEVKLLASQKQTAGPTARIIEHFRLIESHRYIGHVSNMSNLLTSSNDGNDDQTAQYRQASLSLLPDPPHHSATMPVEPLCHAHTCWQPPVLLRLTVRETNKP